ncbi:MAG: DOPA 4,5-dioxygenase family protein [Fimbriimonadaceae bacterium]|nr:DOPA 4,5-dioxygenase family protein [Alphaproteobacteria bacterium]
MTEQRNVSEITDYHAHVYYGAESKPQAEALVSALQTEFPDAVYGRWHDRPVGPHPDWSIQIAFTPDQFDNIVPWLALNRGAQVIFLHPNTGNPVSDHRDHAIWMGAVRPLDLSVL